uniref:Uncharacterized protein n=1 Tax=Clytia hemisphaerica TaxID=252671 RepID=A0A7M5UK71_9CNID
MAAKNWKYFNKLDFVAEEGRQDIYQWYEGRQRKYKGFRKSLRVFRIFAFNGHLIRSFFENFNFMVILQIAIAALVTYACKTLNITYDVHVSLYISPIVFPLAFSINTDFQRKEKVLNDLALFKSSAMMWIFCMRDWREACSFDDHYMKALRNKIKGLMFHLREYLFTEKLDRRKFIVRVIYEDLSDTNQINDKVRCSQMPTSAPLVSRTIHFVSMMCLAFERLRVIREYRSPRSIRSFTKVLIFSLPILLSPYYVYLGQKLNNDWAPYYTCTMVAFVFGALQGVQDKLDDPFDGMSEDDIKLDRLDEWTFHSLEATCHRSYKIGRFQVSSNPSATTVPSNIDQTDFNYPRKTTFTSVPFPRDSYFTRPNFAKGVMGGTPAGTPRAPFEDEDDFEFHPYAGVLHNIKGNTTILRGGQIKRNYKSYDDLSSHASTTMTRDLSASRLSSRVSFADQVLDDNPGQSTQPNGVLPVGRMSSESSTNNLQSMFQLSKPESLTNQTGTSQSLRQQTSSPHHEPEVPLSGVMSYLMNMRLQQENGGKSRSRSNSLKSSSSNHSIKSSHSSPIPAIESRESPKPLFFIGDPPSTSPPTKVRRRPSLSRSISMPETQDLEMTEKTALNVVNNGRFQVNGRSNTPSPTTILRPSSIAAINRFDVNRLSDRTKSRFQVLKRPISPSSEPLLSRNPRTSDEITLSDDDNVFPTVKVIPTHNASKGISSKEVPRNKEEDKKQSDSPVQMSEDLAKLFRHKSFHDTTF